ncbi:MAG: peptidylprolyl isomerase [Gammaproteobacteria bacterium]|nr:peptidylprolyl isomerase [Gammaproteobacteria bacterium]
MLILTLIPALCPGAGVAGDPQIIDRIVAVVDNDVITESELSDRIATVKLQLRRQGMQPPSGPTLQKQILERAVLERIQLQLAESNGIRVDDETLNQAISGIASQNNMSLEEFRDALQNDGFDFVKFREDIRKEITLRRLRQQYVDSRITITDQEVDSFLATQRRQGNGSDEYHIGHILIALPEAATPERIQQVQTRADDILSQLRSGADFHQIAISSSDGQQALNGGDLGWRKAGELPTLFAELVPNMKPGEISNLIRSPSGFHIIELFDHRTGQQHIVTQTLARHILVRLSALTTDGKAKEILADAKRRIAAGEDFATLARNISEDKASASNGGDLGWVEPGQMIPDFEAAMDRLSPGEISDPVKTRFGWHLIQVEDRREYDDTEEFTRDKARDAIYQRRIEEGTEEWLRRLRDEAYVEYRL